jgi:hypothetical protein
VAPALSLPWALTRGEFTPLAGEGVLVAEWTFTFSDDTTWEVTKPASVTLLSATVA